MAAAGALDWLPSARAAVRLCLAAQVALAVAILAGDGQDWLLWRGRDTVAPVPTEPVRPGDQTRPFRPVSVPVHRDPARRLDSPVRLPQVLPRRLTFSMQEAEGYGRVLLLAGTIEPGDALRFAGELEAMPEPPDIIALHSPGGRVVEAQEIGRLIRRKGLDTLIPPDASCLSSCPYILAAGVERVVSRSGWVGLHQSFYDENSILPAFLAVQGIQHGQGDTLAYLGEMGVDPLVLVHVLKTPPDDIYLLVEDELTAYRLATRVVD